MSGKVMKSLALGACILAGAVWFTPGAEAGSSWGFSAGHGGLGFHYSEGNRHRGHYHGHYHGHRSYHYPRHYHGYWGGPVYHYHSFPGYIYTPGFYYHHCY